MDEIRKEYFSEIKERKSALPHIPAPAVPDKSSGEPEVYHSLKFGCPIRWDCWKTIPDDMKIPYLNNLYEVYGPFSIQAIADMWGVSRPMASTELRRLRIPRRKKATHDATVAFYHGMNIIPAGDSAKETAPKRKPRTTKKPAEAAEKKSTSIKDVNITCTIDASKVQDLIKMLGLTGEIRISISNEERRPNEK